MPRRWRNVCGAGDHHPELVVPEWKAGEAAAAAGQATNTYHGGRADAEALDGKGAVESSLAVDLVRAGGMNI